MKSLKSLQAKYELSLIQQQINEAFLYLVSEALQNPGQAPAQTLQPQPPQQTVVQQPAQSQQAPAEQIKPQDLPGIINTIVDQLKNDPQALSELQAAVDSNNIQAVQQLIAKHSAKIQQVIASYQATLEKDIQKLVENIYTLPDNERIVHGIKMFIESNYNEDVLKEFDPDYEDNLLNLYREGIGSDIWQGIKNIGSWAGKQIFKYGPWAALGAVAGGPLGAMAMPLLAKALDSIKGGKSGGVYGGSNLGNKRLTRTTPPGTPAPTSTTVPSTTTTPTASAGPAPTTAPTPAPTGPTSTSVPPMLPKTTSAPAPAPAPAPTEVVPPEQPYPPRRIKNVTPGKEQEQLPAGKQPLALQEPKDDQKIIDAAADEYVKLRKKGARRTPEDTARMQEIKKLYGDKLASVRTIHSSYNPVFGTTADKLIKEFYRTSR